MTEIVVLKDALFLERQKQAAMATKACLLAFVDMVVYSKNTNLLQIEQKCDEIIKAHNCKPTFFGFKNFPGKVCLSVNNTLVHGIPKDYTLKKGDVVTLDLGATFEGAIADTALTLISEGFTKDPNIYNMIFLCQEALKAGISAVKVGNRLGAIGHAIFESVKTTKFGLVVDYGGHGINYNEPHAYPFVNNKSKKEAGVPIVPGFSIAIEPMLTLDGAVHTKVLADKWSVNTKAIGCHFEHSVTVDLEGNAHVVTEHGVDVTNHLGVE
jgi:methionyl aminopeptidase